MLKADGLSATWIQPEGVHDAKKRGLNVKTMAGHHLATLQLSLIEMIQALALARPDQPDLMANTRALKFRSLRLMVFKTGTMAPTELLATESIIVKHTITHRQLSTPVPEFC